MLTSVCSPLPLSASLLAAVALVLVTLPRKPPRERCYLLATDRAFFSCAPRNVLRTLFAR